MDDYYPLERDAPKRKPCTCGGEKVRLIGSQWLDTPSVRARILVPAEEQFRGTGLEEAARNGELVNYDLPPSHPGYWKRDPERRGREYVDVGRK